MLKEFNFNQVLKFFLLVTTLQKKNTLVGFFIGLVPMLISAFSIELFIGKLLNSGFAASGTKAVIFLFFAMISGAITQSTDGLKKYGAIIKNSYLNPTSVIVSEILVQYMTFLVALLIVSVFFKLPILNVATYVLISLGCVCYCYFVSYYLAVLGAVLDDFGRVLSIMFQMLFWVSPILFSLRQLDPKLALLFTLNPFHIFFEAIYLVIDPNQLNAPILLISLFSSAIFIAILMIHLSKLRQKIIVFL